MTKTKKERTAEYMKAYRVANKERIAKQKMEYYEANKEHLTEYRKAWREANGEKHRESAKQWRKNNPEKVKDSNRKWIEKNRGEKREYLRTYMQKWRKNNPEKARDLTMKWRVMNREKFKVEQCLQRAVKNGQVKKEDSCSRCNSIGKVMAHHEDYTKPLDIIWLCPLCHVQHHRNKATDKNAKSNFVSTDDDTKYKFI